MADTALDFAALLQLLGFSVGEYVSIGHEDTTVASPWYTAVMDPADAPDYVAKLADTADVFFGVCPTEGPSREGVDRGDEGDVTRLSSLWADLDFKPTGCRNEQTVDAIIGDLTAALGTRPSAIIHSGNGKHPYWPVADGWVKGGDIGPARMLIKQWERLVVKTAKSHGAQVDPVFDLARMMRVPGTFNNKRVP